QIRAMTPSIDWHLIVQSILPEKNDIPDIIIVNSPGFQERLEVIRELAGSLNLPYRQPLRILNAALSGVSADVVPDRWKTCVAVVNSQLGDMAGQYFISDSFKGNSRTQVRDMIESLRETYLKSFPNLNWLDDATTEGAIKKMKAIVQLTGFSTNSPNVGSSKNVDDYYQDYKVDPKDYFGNQLRMNVWGTERYFNELDKPVNKKKMHMSPQTVNAYYSPTENQIVFPAGILQPPFFHTENPEYINWGGIGVVAGHEITHGFDNKGHQFDALGRLANWWSNSTTEAFNKKAQCFIDQYGNFTVKGSDGKDYNRPESAIRQMRTDPHSPAKWRINGAVQNSVGFAEAFKCKAKAPMNPDKKCDLW
ncbi:Endothelin-converting enzyme 2, partial [Linnemannia elongata]